MDTDDLKDIDESPRSVLLQVMNRFVNNSSTNGEQRKIVERAGRDYSALPDENDELSEEITLLQEILVKQEQTYNAEIKDFERQIQNCQLQLQQSELQNEQLDKKICEEYKKDEDLKHIIDEYDQTVCKLVNEKLKVQDSHNEEIGDLEESLLECRNTYSKVQTKFANLYKSYESKQHAFVELQTQVKGLQQKLNLSHLALEKNHNAYLELEKHVKDQIENAVQELNNLKQSHFAENTKIKGLTKKLEIQIGSLEGMIQQKERENVELTAIYEDCLNKVAQNS